MTHFASPSLVSLEHRFRGSADPPQTATVSSYHLVCSVHGSDLGVANNRGWSENSPLPAQNTTAPEETAGNASNGDPKQDPFVVTSTASGHPFCEGLNEGNNISRIYSVHTSIDWQWFVVVRDPLDRFVSNYVDKCMLERRKTGALCYGCDDERDVECVLKNIEERGFRWAEKGDVFPDFFDAHLFPQNWQCDFGSFINKYEIIHFSPPKSPGYAAMLTQIMDIFRRKSVPPATLNLITEALNGTTTKHSTNDKPERAEIKEMIGRNTRLMRRIVNLYYFDYRLFGYPMPEGL
uniref:Sulfotransfer_1 domain-containing protein n=1 Tax=Bursaphelenchus xylophilus TaxID=6326 RepID=A0A1I7S9W2_BURXY